MNSFQMKINEISRSIENGEENALFSEWLKDFLVKAGRTNAEKCREFLAFLDSPETDGDSGSAIAKAIEAIKKIKTTLIATAKQLESFGDGIKDNFMYRRLQESDASLDGMILQLQQIDAFFDVLFNNASKQIDISYKAKPSSGRSNAT